jgi:hypothetical protein
MPTWFNAKVTESRAARKALNEARTAAGLTPWYGEGDPPDQPTETATDALEEIPW